MTVLAALLLPARPAAAQAPSMTGAWELTWRSPRFGEQTMRLELVQEGSALAGKAEGPFGELAIRDGQVAGDSVRFYLDMSAANRAGGARRAVVQEVRGARQGDVVEGAIHVSTQGGRGIGPGRLGGRPFVMRRVTQSP